MKAHAPRLFHPPRRFPVAAFALGILAIFALPWLAVQACAAPSNHTANHIKGRGELLLDREVAIDVAWVQPVRWADDDSTSWFLAYTWDEREKVGGGAILVAIPKHNLKRFLDKYGTSPDIEGRGRDFDLDTRRLTAPLRSGSNGSLYLDLSDGSAVAPADTLRKRIRETLESLRKD